MSINPLINVERRQTLFSGIGHNDVHRLVSALEPYGVDFHRVPWVDRLVATVTGREFHLIFVGYPPLGMPLEDFVGALRDAGSASREAGLVVIADPRGLDLDHPVPLDNRPASNSEPGRPRVRDWAGFVLSGPGF